MGMSAAPAYAQSPAPLVIMAKQIHYEGVCTLTPIFPFSSPDGFLRQLYRNGVSFKQSLTS